MENFSECLLTRARALENEHNTLLDTLGERLAREEALQHAIQDLQTAAERNSDHTRTLNETIQAELKALRIGDHELHSRRTGTAHTSQNRQIRALKTQLTEQADLVELAQKSQQKTLKTLEAEAEENMQFVKDTKRYKRLQQLKETLGMVQNEVSTRQDRLQDISTGSQPRNEPPQTVPNITVTTPTPQNPGRSEARSAVDKAKANTYWSDFRAEVIRLAKHGTALHKEMAKRSQRLEAKLVAQRLSVLLTRCDRLEKLGELVEKKQQEQQAMDEQMLTTQQKMSDLIAMQHQSSQSEVRWIVGDSSSSDVSRYGRYGVPGDRLSSTSALNSMPEDNVTPTARRGVRAPDVTRDNSGETESASPTTKDDKNLSDKDCFGTATLDVSERCGETSGAEKTQNTDVGVDVGTSVPEGKEVSQEAILTGDADVGYQPPTQNKEYMDESDCTSPKPSGASDFHCGQGVVSSQQEVDTNADPTQTQTQPIINAQPHSSDIPTAIAEGRLDPCPSTADKNSAHNSPRHESQTSEHSDKGNETHNQEHISAVRGEGQVSPQGVTEMRVVHGSTEAGGGVTIAVAGTGDMPMDVEGSTGPVDHGTLPPIQLPPIVAQVGKGEDEAEGQNRAGMAENRALAQQEMDIDAPVETIEKAVGNVSIGDSTAHPITHPHERFVIPRTTTQPQRSSPVVIPCAVTKHTAPSVPLASPDMFKFDCDSDSDDDFYQARKMYSPDKTADNNDTSAMNPSTATTGKHPTDINTRFSLGASGFDPFKNRNFKPSA